MQQIQSTAPPMDIEFCLKNGNYLGDLYRKCEQEAKVTTDPEALRKLSEKMTFIKEKLVFLGMLYNELKGSGTSV